MAIYRVFLILSEPYCERGLPERSDCIVYKQKALCLSSEQET